MISNIVKSAFIAYFLYLVNSHVLQTRSLYITWR